MRLIIFIVSLALMVAIVSALGLLSADAGRLRSGLRDLLVGELVADDPPAAGISVDIIYILGGSPESLKYKYKVAADLYRTGVSKKIWILGRTGKTRYSNTLRRNLTNDEWSLLQFRARGIPPVAVEIVHMEDGFFGTFSEARNVSVLMKDRGLQSILIIAAPHHTHRVNLSFQNYIDQENAAIFVQGSGERVPLHTLLLEYCKLIVYKYFLMPLHRIEAA